MAKRILVVDDETKLLRAIAVTLRHEGYEVATARSGTEALVRINEAVPDLIVSDIRMPGMDGHQLARALQSNARTSLIPIIFLTAKDDRQDRIAGLRTGVDAYLTKPFDPEELIAVIVNILTRVERTSAELSRLVSVARDERLVIAQSKTAIELTEGERRVARLVASGQSNREIATTLGLSIRTVEGHISNMLAKNGWNNRVEIARHIFAVDQRK